MKIVVTGSLGNISKPLTGKLVKAGHQVTVVSSSADKAAAIEDLGASPAIGSVSDTGFLTQVFTGADVVYLMIPNDPNSPNFREHIAGIGRNYAEALKASGVSKIVFLSSIGAHLDGGTGPIAGVHDAEEIFKKLEGIDIKILRPAFFYTNFFSNVDMIKQAGFIGGNYAETNNLIMVHPNDIAEVAADEIQKPFIGTTIIYIASDERTLGEVATALGSAIGKPDLKWVEFTDEQNVQGMLQAGLSQGFADSYTEMGAAIRKGILWGDYVNNKPAEFGKTKLEDFAKDFAAAYSA